MRRLFGVSLLLILIGLIAGCGGGSGSSNQGSNNSPTIRWLDDGTETGFLQFYTNDADMCDKGFWYRYDKPDDTMGTVETQVKKISGSSLYPFGIIFCFQQTDTEIHYYRLLIYTDGSYTLGKTVTNTLTNLTNTTIIAVTNNNGASKEYIQSSLLNQGYNVTNTITVVQEATAGNFTIYFNRDKNPNPAATFTETSYKGGKYGFYASVGLPSEESFPNTPVDVRFRQITPTPPETSQSSALKSQNVRNGMVWGSEKLH